MRCEGERDSLSAGPICDACADEKFPCENPMKGFAVRVVPWGPLTRIRFTPAPRFLGSRTSKIARIERDTLFPAFSRSFQDSPITGHPGSRFTEDVDPLQTLRREIHRSFRPRHSPRLVSRVFRGAASVTARERMRRRATTLALVASIWASARGARAVPAVCTEARLEGLPTLCANAAPDTVQTGPNTTAACCDELRELDDARCFCSEPFLGLDATRQGALVPALATAPRRCGVDTRVGRACLSVAGDDGAEAEEDETREDGAGETCPTGTLIRLVQDGCAGALTETCCDAIASLNARSCFCEDDVVDVLRSFPASFRRMFSETRASCGFVVRGGRRCEPFPGKPPTPPPPPVPRA